MFSQKKAGGNLAMQLNVSKMLSDTKIEVNMYSPSLNYKASNFLRH